MKYKSKREQYSDEVCDLLESSLLIYPEQSKHLRNYILSVAG